MAVRGSQLELDLDQSKIKGKGVPLLDVADLRALVDTRIANSESRVRCN